MQETMGHDDALNQQIQKNPLNKQGSFFSILILSCRHISLMEERISMLPREKKPLSTSCPL